jgi:hypothetical protein
MADVTQNISAQLFVKELPTTSTANFNGCKQDFRSPYLTTCVNEIDSDKLIEDAFQKQLSLTEYYKSPYVFNTIKQDYMSKTIDGKYETQEVNLEPEPQTGETGSQPNTAKDFVMTGKESFGSMNNNNCIFGILVAAIILYFILQNK